MATAASDWNAASYDRVADPQARWGAEVLERLPLRGDETVLDAGCGTGRVTQLLLDRLPRGRVVALDASAAMLTEARRRLARVGDQVTYLEADVERPLPLGEPVDAILSTATFHWVMDHDALFANLAAVLRPGGWLVAQCGGFGNIARFLEVARSVDPTFRKRHNFQTAEATSARLERAGFEEISTWLSDAPTRFEPGAPFEAFLRTVCLRPNIDRLPPAEQEPFLKAVAARMPEPVLDYVRLNITARRLTSAPQESTDAQTLTRSHQFFRHDAATGPARAPPARFVSSSQQSARQRSFAERRRSSRRPSTQDSCLESTIAPLASPPAAGAVRSIAFVSDSQLEQQDSCRRRLGAAVGSGGWDGRCRREQRGDQLQVGRTLDRPVAGPADEPNEPGTEDPCRSRTFA